MVQLQTWSAQLSKRQIETQTLDLLYGPRVEVNEEHHERPLETMRQGDKQRFAPGM